MPYSAGPHGEAPVSPGAERSEGKTQCFLSVGRQGRAGKHFRIASLNDSGSWGLGAIPSCLIAGAGLIKGRGNTDLVCKS